MGRYEELALSQFYSPAPVGSLISLEFSSFLHPHNFISFPFLFKDLKMCVRQFLYFCLKNSPLPPEGGSPIEFKLLHHSRVNKYGTSAFEQRLHGADRDIYHRCDFKCSMS